MTNIIIALAQRGFRRVANGGGAFIHMKELRNGWTLSVCNGAAGEVGAEDRRFHVNAHRTEDCEKFIHGQWICYSRIVEGLAAWEQVVNCLAENQEEA